MTHRERTLAVLNDQPYDRLPVVHFGYWGETLQKWADEGHLTRNEAMAWGDWNEADFSIAEKLGFDFGWSCMATFHSWLHPYFERKVIETAPDGTQKVRNEQGAIILQKPGAGSIPAEVGHTLTDRASWEKHYKWRVTYSPDRVIPPDPAWVAGTDLPRGLHCGSLFGQIRDWLGVEGVSYLYVDDEDLYQVIIDTVGDMTYRGVEAMLSTGARFDFAHFWEDICYKNGPLVTPSVFAEYVGPHYKRITDLLRSHGVEVISLDCDGLIDALIPIWLENGVNTMFPIEVGTWHASIAPWREQYGKDIRGVGGMNKHVFAEDYAAVDAEIERLKPLVALGGYIPCPDHRIPPDAKWENVQYYCQRLRDTFVG